jgi:hypothetical protein
MKNLMLVLAVGIATEARAELHATAPRLLVDDADPEVEVERGSPAWYVGGIAGGAGTGIGIGFLSGLALTNAFNDQSGKIALAAPIVGAIVGGTTGLVLGHLARDGSLAGRILVIVADGLATFVTTTALCALVAGVVGQGLAGAGAI